MGTIYSCTVLFEGEGDGNCGGAFFWLLGGRLLGVEVFFPTIWRVYGLSREVKVWLFEIYKLDFCYSISVLLVSKLYFIRHYLKLFVCFFSH